MFQGIFNFFTVFFSHNFLKITGVISICLPVVFNNTGFFLSIYRIFLKITGCFQCFYRIFPILDFTFVIFIFIGYSQDYRFFFLFTGWLQCFHRLLLKFLQDFLKYYRLFSEFLPVIFNITGYFFFCRFFSYSKVLKMFTGSFLN